MISSKYLFQNWGLKYKLFCIPSLALIAFLAIFFMTRSFTQKNEFLLNQVMSGNVPAWEMSKDLMQAVENIHRGFQEVVAAQDEKDLYALDKQRDSFVDLIAKAKTNPFMDDADLDEVKKMFFEYFNKSRETSRKMINESGTQQSINVMGSMQENHSRIIDRLKANTQRDRKNIDLGFAEMQKNNRAMLLTAGISILICILILFGISFFIIQFITVPLGIAIHVAKNVADGDLTIKIPKSNINDETGTLLKSLANMMNNLRDLTEKIKEGAHAFAAAGTQISTSITEIASGAAETASAASETSTTVEEVRQTAHDSNQRSKNVSESAQKAVQISQAGEKSVASTVESMRRIEAQMSSIAESILKLSEHGQAIGEIIATVENVAEQSRLLAVNASIEAVRAGEHGKGFAVVAQEVRILAEQSKQATARVRSILDDIQRSTSEAVMKTEQGSKAVEAGVKQSNESGEAIQRLANSVAEAAQATTQISVSSQEQLVGMDQVVSAMESIKQASDQNVSATKQVETATNNLQDFGKKLTELLENYKI